MRVLVLHDEYGSIEIHKISKMRSIVSHLLADVDTEETSAETLNIEDNLRFLKWNQYLSFTRNEGCDTSFSLYIRSVL